MIHQYNSDVYFNILSNNHDDFIHTSNNDGTIAAVATTTTHKYVAIRSETFPLYTNAHTSAHNNNVFIELKATATALYRK